MAGISLVYCLGPAGLLAEEKPAARQPAPVTAFTGELPVNARDTRDALAAAAESGDIEELRQWGDIPPDLGPAQKDPIAYWRKISRDGEGREVLSVLLNLLALPPARLPIGSDPENNIVFVWPYLAELPLDKLTRAQEVELYRLMPPDAAKAMREKKKWTWWRLAIGADGSWRAFRTYE